MTILLIVNLIIAIMTGNFLYAGQESGVPYFCTPLLNNYKGLKVEKAEEVEMKEKSAAAEVAGGATELNDFINQELWRSEDWVKRDYTVVFEKIKNTKQNLFLDFLEKLEKVHNCNDRQKKEKKANALRAELVRAILAYNEKEKKQEHDTFQKLMNKLHLPIGCGGIIVFGSFTVFLISLIDYLDLELIRK